MQAGPGDENVRVDLVDGVGGCGVVSHEVEPVVANGGCWCGCVDGPAKFVSQRHGYDIRVVFGPIGYVLETALPVVYGKVIVVEPCISIFKKGVLE